MVRLPIYNEWERYIIELVNKEPMPINWKKIEEETQKKFPNVSIDEIRYFLLHKYGVMWIE